MTIQTLPVAEVLDKFDDCNFTLTFLESSLRSLIKSGNVSEKNVDDGLTVIMLELIREYQKLKIAIQSYLLSATSNTDMAKPNDQNQT